MLLLNHEVISTLFAALNSSTSFRTLPDSSPLLLLSVPFGHPAHPLVTPLHELNDTPVLLPTSLTLRTQFSQFTLLTYLHSLFFHYSLSLLLGLPSFCCRLRLSGFLYPLYPFSSSTYCIPVTFFTLCTLWIVFIPPRCLCIL